MQIQSVKYNSYPKQYNNKVPNHFVLKNSPRTSINFGGHFSYDDFCKYFRKFYPDDTFKNSVYSIITNAKNYMASGFYADIYTIPSIEKYLIRIERENFRLKSFMQNEITAAPQNESLPNFGQYIATNNEGFFIVKKVQGECNSIPYWPKKIKQLELGTAEINEKETQFILKKIKKLSEFPQKSYDKLAKKIQIINKNTDCEIDMMNPNNLLINNENKSINIIDIWYQSYGDEIKAPYNGIESMLHLMLDPLTHCKVYEKLPPEDKIRLIQSSEKIIQKVLEASEKNGLKSISQNVITSYKKLDKRLNINFAIPAYNDFLDLYPVLTKYTTSSKI